MYKSSRNNGKTGQGKLFVWIVKAISVQKKLLDRLWLKFDSTNS